MSQKYTQTFEPICINNIDEETIRNVDSDSINNIVTKKFTLGNNMKDILCYINTKFENGIQHINSANNIYRLNPKKFKEIFTHIKELENYNRGANGIVLTAKMFEKVDVIIKISSGAYYDNIESEYRECNIGLHFINKMRNIVPSFVYTFSGIMGNEKELIEKKLSKIKTDNILSVYEKIDGESVAVSMPSMSKERFLLIFLQILISIEIAQREFKFVHYDLHTSNVLLKKLSRPYEYSVLLDTEEYKFVVDEIPVIIDFGLSHVEKDGKTFMPFVDEVDSRAITYNVYNPIKDIYHFLVNCHDNSYSLYEENLRILLKKATGQKTQKTQEELEEIEKNFKRDSLFHFIEELMFDLFEHNNPKRKNPYPDFFTARVGYSRRVLRTLDLFDKNPLDCIHFILRDKKYGYLINKSKKFFIYPRNTYQIIRFDNEVHKLFYKEKIEERLNVLEKCLGKVPSYIYYNYCFGIIKIYKKIYNHKLPQSIIDRFIKNDKKILKKFFDIKIPSDEYFEKAFDIIEGIRDTPLKYNIRASKKQMDGIFKYEKDILPFLNIYYIIIQFNMTVIYGKWITKFENSDIYNFYKFNRRRVEKYKKFIMALQDFTTDSYFQNVKHSDYSNMDGYIKYINHYGIFNF